MRRVTLLMHISLDGFVADSNGEMDWILHDEELFQYVSELFESVGAALYGRVTYQMMESYWPTVPKNPESTKQELHHAAWVEQLEKVVFSTSLQEVTWNNTKLIHQDIAAQLTALKNTPGKDLMIFGSPRLAHSLMPLGLIDDYFLQINPILLGKGTRLFPELTTRVGLSLISTRIFRNGVLGLHYQKS